MPFVYYGEEIGKEGAKPDPRLRTPMQWSDAPGRLPALLYAVRNYETFFRCNIK